MAKRLNHHKLNAKLQKNNDSEDLHVLEMYADTAKRIGAKGRTAWDELREKAEFKIKSQGYRIAFLEKRVKELEEELGKVRTEQIEDRGSQ